MRKFSRVMIALLFLLAAGYSLGQDQKDAKAKDAKPAEQRETPTAFKNTFRLEFIVTETEEGKVVNERSYSMLLIGPDRESIRVGNRVPVSTASSKDGVAQVQYLEVGLSIDCFLRETYQGITPLSVNFEMSSVIGEQNGPMGNPVLRTVKGSSNTLLHPGKKEILVSVDDVNSKRHYQLSVLATKVD